MGNNRTKGHNAERHYRRIFKELFPHCETSRYASKMMDDAKVDLVGLPFLTQIKAGKQRALKHHQVLEDMHNLVPDDKKDDIKIIIHHKEGRRGKPRGEYDQLVTMSFDDFMELITKLKENDLL